jgi:hypothetical protein
MEQQLINAFMRFTAKAGAGEYMKGLVQTTDENGNPKSWTTSEMSKAIDYLHHCTEHFDRADALTIIRTIQKKFHITTDDLREPNQDEPAPDIIGAKGLQ